jgi:mono/diheme cytochrome c family protein
MSINCWFISRSRLAPILIATMALAASIAASAQTSVEPVPGDYRIVRGKVDRGTFAGWRIYHTACFGCHGVDAKGTDLAPNLIERVRTMTPRAFATKVLTSYRIALPPGETAEENPAAALDAMIEQAMRRDRKARGQLLMPAWDDSPGVTPHVLDIYAYLSARGDGKLGPGRPPQIGKQR